MTETVSPTQMDRKAREWVQSNFENFEHWDKWDMSDYWFFIEEFYTGGPEAFETNNR